MQVRYNLDIIAYNQWKTLDLTPPPMRNLVAKSRKTEYRKREKDAQDKARQCIKNQKEMSNASRRS